MMIAVAVVSLRPGQAPAAEGGETPRPSLRPPAAPAFLVLELEACKAAPPAEIRNIVEVELRRSVALLDAGGVGPSSTAAPGVTTARVACDDLVATIDVADPMTGKALRRTVDLQRVAPVARAHLVALSVVELLLASWSELLNDGQPAGRPVGAPAPPEARAAALELVRGRAGGDVASWMSLRLLAVAAVSSFAAGKLLGTEPRLYGGALMVAGDGPRHFGWIVDLSFQQGERVLSLGRVSADSLSGLAAAVVHVSRGRFVLRAGLGARVGFAWLSGTPADPETATGGVVRGGWWGPAALFDGSVRIGRRGVVAIGVEIGRTQLPVTAFVQGDRPVVVGGTWLRGGLGVGFVL